MAVYEVTLKVHIYVDPKPSNAIALEHALAQLQIEGREDEVVTRIEYVAAEEDDAPAAPPAAAVVDVTFRRTSCRHCGIDIEGPFVSGMGAWFDRGNNSTCPVGQLHAPVDPTPAAAGRKATR